MEHSQQDKEVSTTIRDSPSGPYIHYEVPQDDDSIQLQSPEATALIGLLSDLEFRATLYESMATAHWNNFRGQDAPITATKEESRIAYGIYKNKAQDMRDLVNKWKPNKK